MQEGRSVRGSARRARAFLGPRRASGAPRRPRGCAPRVGRGRRLPCRAMTRSRCSAAGRWARRSSAACSTAAGTPTTLAVAEVDADRRRDLEAPVPQGARRAEPGVGGRRRRRRGRRGEAGRRRRRARAALAGAAARRARPVDRGGRHDRDARSRRAGPAGRAGDAEHARARRARASRDRAPARPRPTSTSISPSGSSARSASWCASPSAARRGHRAVGIGSGVRVPRRRGMIEAGVLVGLPARRSRAARRADTARFGDAARRGRRRPRGAARRGHVAGRHDRGRAARARSARRARRVPRRGRARRPNAPRELGAG